jgi:hypothetical protein
LAAGTVGVRTAAAKRREGAVFIGRLHAVQMKPFVKTTELRAARRNGASGFDKGRP